MVQHIPRDGFGNVKSQSRIPNGNPPVLFHIRFNLGQDHASALSPAFFRMKNSTASVAQTPAIQTAEKEG